MRRRGKYFRNPSGMRFLLLIHSVFAIITAIQGAWLSWLERTVHIREVVGSSPSVPTTTTKEHLLPGAFLFHLPAPLRSPWGRPWVRVPCTAPTTTTTEHLLPGAFLFHLPAPLRSPWGRPWVRVPCSAPAEASE